MEKDVMKEQIRWLHHHLIETEDALDSLFFEYGNADAEGANELFEELGAGYELKRMQR